MNGREHMNDNEHMNNDQHNINSTSRDLIACMHSIWHEGAE